MRRALALLAIGAALGSAGCDLGGGEDDDAGAPPDRSPVPPSADHADRARPDADASDREVIDGWVKAVAGRRYERAAAYFAPNAVVEQAGEIRLRTRSDAIAFNRSLPCSAELTDVEDEGGTSLAAFRLLPGAGGPCEGSARVRFTIRDGLIREWRQLPEPAAPQGDEA
ncbi:MAG: nuclear transport factor 2 family protein [Thermoleophilaceae bacterium]